MKYENPYNEPRRLRIMAIAPELVIAPYMNGADQVNGDPVMLPYFPLIHVEEPLPKDSAPAFCVFDNDQRYFLIAIESSTFAEIAPGEEIPPIAPLFKSLSPTEFDMALDVPACRRFLANLSSIIAADYQRGERVSYAGREFVKNAASKQT